MPIIITNMDMPINCERCFACEYISNLYSCVLLKHEVGDEIVLGQRAKDCPLKSTDGVVSMETIDKMIAEMEQSSYCDKETKMVKNCNASGLSVAIKIINKYCKENVHD